MIVGIGIDIQAIEKLGESLKSPAFTAKIFTEAEISAANTQPRRLHEHLAGKFAVKEACMKALSSGIRQGVWFRDIEVLNQSSGAPYLVLHRRAEEIAQERGVNCQHVSISHSAGVAVGIVILETLPDLL